MRNFLSHCRLEVPALGGYFFNVVEIDLFKPASNH